MRSGITCPAITRSSSRSASSPVVPPCTAPHGSARVTGANLWPPMWLHSHTRSESSGRCECRAVTSDRPSVAQHVSRLLWVHTRSRGSCVLLPKDGREPLARASGSHFRISSSVSAVPSRMSIPPGAVRATKMRWPGCSEGWKRDRARSTPTPWAFMASSASRTGTGRLESVTALRPQGPGCSRMTHVSACGAVPPYCSWACAASTEQGTPLTVHHRGRRWGQCPAGPCRLDVHPDPAEARGSRRPQRRVQGPDRPRRL